MAVNAPPALLTVSEVAAMLRLHIHSVKRIAPAELPYFRVSSRGDRRYRRPDVEAYIARRAVGGEVLA